MVEVQKLRTLYDFCKPRAALSAEIRVVEVQKLGALYDFCKPRATLCGDSRGRGSRIADFSDFCKPRATLCGDSRGRGSKTVNFLRFLTRARDPLRRFAWSRFKNCGLFTISASRARRSAGIVRVEALSLWRRANLLLAKWPLEVVSWLARLLSQSRGRGFDSPPAPRHGKSQLLSTDVVCGACSRSSG